MAFGNQYTLQIDEARQYITGTVGGGPWILTGSYVQSSPTDPWVYELTVTNSNGTGQSGFVAVYKLKGVQPNGEWYYDTGFGGQPFTFVRCGAVISEAEAAEAALKPGERRGMRHGE